MIFCPIAWMHVMAFDILRREYDIIGRAVYEELEMAYDLR